MNYEKNISELEQIVKSLSDDKLGVEEGLKLYEKGISLAGDCLQYLTDIKGKLEVLNKQLEALEAEADSDEDDDDDADD